MRKVNAWVEMVNIPTYEPGKPEKLPMFFEKRVYQGSSGVVYPNPIVESISVEKCDKQYQCVFIENQYLKLMLLPELGGRIQMAFDKVRGRHFIYYNQVIKPALVGLAGPWISGGIEFNWPQHHRPSTFSPVDFTIIENDDGSKTVWMNEVERMFQTKGMAGVTLFPDKAYVQISGRLYNRTSLPQTFLWWANPAVKVNDHYQSVFPPDVHAVFDHGKRDVVSFPLAKGKYYKVDYGNGTDISWYKNIPVPTSYMAVNSMYDFMGGYEHDSRSGMLHIADHHISPGKKQWTWGNGEFGKAWDKNLTDEDGPYIELMTGVFTDNQPDFSWLAAYEQKNFEQYFLPYSEIGVVKNATKDAAINVELISGKIVVGVYATALCKNLQLRITHNGQILSATDFSCEPGNPFTCEVNHSEDIDLSCLAVSVVDLDQGHTLVAYRPEPRVGKPLPEPAIRPQAPQLINSCEELFLTGLHLEQYRHATYSAKDYYEEALNRDSTDVRNNNALGVWYLRRGKFANAAEYFRKAIQTLTSRNGNPYDGEAYFNLGVSLRYLQRDEEAFDAFYKAVWNDAWQHAGYLQLAQLSCKKQDWVGAFDFINQSLAKNDNSHTARHLKAIVLRKLKKFDELDIFCEASLELDPFNFGCRYENILYRQIQGKDGAETQREELKKVSRNSSNNFIEYATDYAAAGLNKEAIDFLNLSTEAGLHDPMVYYYLSYFLSLDLREAAALEMLEIASEQDPGYCFPNKLMDIKVLENAVTKRESDFKAFYYLGNLWYDKRQYDDAVDCWQHALAANGKLPGLYRNMSLAYFNKLRKQNEAEALMMQAFELDKSNARIFMELDQLHKLLRCSPEDRLNFLNRYPDLVNSRDDLYLEKITLCNTLERFESAIELITSRKFHPWEGGEGKVSAQFCYSYLELAKQAIREGEFAKSLDLLLQVDKYPDNLGEGKLFGTRENEKDFLTGCALFGLCKTSEAFEHFQKATSGDSEPQQAIFYNDPQPDAIMYQALSWRNLGNEAKAAEIFSRLMQFGLDHMNDDIQIDYFAVSLPDMQVFDKDLNRSNHIHCKYLVALGKMGLGQLSLADECLSEVIEMDCNHQGARAFKRMLPHLVTNFSVKM